MTESFWFLTGEDGPEGDAERLDLSGLPFDARDGFAPYQEPMRAHRSGPRRAPSTDQKKIRRQIHRSGELESKKAAYGTDRLPPHERVTDWDDVVGDHDTSDWRIHRGIKLWPKGDLWDRVNDESRPVHERAHELIKHITSERGNLGMHWSSDEDFAKQVAKDGGWSAIGNNGAPKDMEHALSMPVVVHARWPHKEHFETDPNELHANHVLPYGYSENLANEWETPLKKHAPVHITGVTWAAYDNPRKHEWVHHTFDEPIRHQAGLTSTAAGYMDANDWDANLQRIDSIHRGVGVHLPPELHNLVHDESQPVEDRAHALLRHLAGERTDDSRSGLGPHWTSEKSVAEDFAEKDAQHRANTAHPHQGEGAPWGSSPGERDGDALWEHLTQGHGIHEDRLHDSDEWLHGAHVHLHSSGGQKVAHPDLEHDHDDLDGEFRAPPVKHGQPATAVVLHGPTPQREDISDAGQGEGGMTYNWDSHGEREVTLNKGANVPVTGISWALIRAEDHPDKEWLPQYTRHTFHTPQPHHAARTATVLNTQVERLNKGDRVRNATGQTFEVKRIRPHETDSTLMYLDTDLGTSTVKRGTDFQVIPRNSQQQELPDTGNPMGGNFNVLPGAGRTPGGGGLSSGEIGSTCPNCGNTGTLHVQGGDFVCSVCGFTISSTGSPGDLTFTNQPSGHLPARRRPGEVPRAHIWASKYVTSNDSSSQIARRARQVSGGDQ